jgi:AraC-like DNA-binding protein
MGFLAAWDRRPELLLPRLEGTSTAAAAVHRGMLRLARCWFETPEGGARLQNLKLHLLELLLQLRSAFIDCDARAPEAKSARAEREARLGRVMEHVAHHLHGRISQPEVAKIAGMSTSRFRAFFKETTGWGFADYLRELRLERAARLLRESAESVAEVAYRTGFADQSHLQRLFKARYAVCPLAYRKQHRPRENAPEGHARGEATTKDAKDSFPSRRRQSQVAR